MKYLKSRIESIEVFKNYDVELDDVKEIVDIYNGIVTQKEVRTTNEKVIEFFEKNDYIIGGKGKEKTISPRFEFMKCGITYNDFGALGNEKSYLHKDLKGNHTFAFLNNICKTTLEERHDENGYDKVSFYIDYKDHKDDKRETYKGRYDVGGDSENLIKHIYMFLLNESGLPKEDILERENFIDALILQLHKERVTKNESRSWAMEKGRD